MQSLLAAAWTLAFLPKAIGLEFGFGYSQQNGQTRLLGSSFGAPGADKTFDYVVIGGGTAGLTVAERLAENPNITVAVVEAGGFYEIDSGNVTQVPAYEALYASDPPTIDWGIYTTPQAQLDGRSIHYPQGKCLGGSSARNGMVYQRGTKGSYQAWADAVGDQSYQFDSILPYFQKSVNFTPPNYAKRGGPNITYDPSAYSPAGGPLKLSYWGYYLPVSEFFRRGLQSLGFKEISSIENGGLLGFAQYPATLNPDVMIRDSSETSFGQQAIAQTALQFYQRSLAKQILFSGKTATGVRVETAGISYTLSAKKEVILAAGAFRSPQLLMVSGIGPASTLQSLSIPVIADLPGVGQNMLDQPGFGIVFRVNVTTNSQLFSNATFAAEAERDFINNQAGPLTVFSGNYIAWEHLPSDYYDNLTTGARSDLSKYPSDWPDLQYVPYTPGLISTNDTSNYAAVTMTLQKTTSVGNVTINSTDTTDNPLVNVNWLLTSTDQQLAVQGIRRAREMSAAFGIVSGPEVAPGPQVQTDAQILEFLQQTVATIHHAVATCKMGKPNDPTAVVDSHGRVLGGIKGVRVVDASAWPILPPGQVMSTVYMLAEKLAADILGGQES